MHLLRVKINISYYMTWNGALFHFSRFFSFTELSAKIRPSSWYSTIHWTIIDLSLVSALHAHGVHFLSTRTVLTGLADTDSASRGRWRESATVCGGVRARVCGPGSSQCEQRAPTTSPSLPRQKPSRPAGRSVCDGPSTLGELAGSAATWRQDSQVIWRRDRFVMRRGASAGQWSVSAAARMTAARLAGRAAVPRGRWVGVPAGRGVSTHRPPARACWHAPLPGRVLAEWWMVKTSLWHLARISP